MSDLPTPALLRHGQARRVRGLGGHRGQRGEGVQVSWSECVFHFSTQLTLHNNNNDNNNNTDITRAGTSVQLVCVIRDVTQPPSFIFW